MHGTLTHTPAEQSPVHAVLFHKPSVEQVSALRPSLEQRVAPGEHSRQFPATHAGVRPLHMEACHVPPLQTRGVVADVHSCAPSVHTQLPALHTGVSPRQSAWATQAPSAEQSKGVLLS